MRWPRILTWWSARPRKSSRPSSRRRTRSPVRYMRLARRRTDRRRKRSAVRSRAAPVAARHPVAADEELARHAGRHRLARVVEHVEPGVGDRRADVDHGLVGGRRAGRGPDRGLGRAVHVLDPRRRDPAELGDQRAGERLAADHQLPDAAERRARLVVHHEHPRHARGALQVRDAVADDLRGDREVVVGDRRRGVRPASTSASGRKAVEHLGGRDAVVDQAGDLVDADALQLLDARDAVLDGAEQARVPRSSGGRRTRGRRPSPPRTASRGRAASGC